MSFDTVSVSNGGESNPQILHSLSSSSLKNSDGDNNQDANRSIAPSESRTVSKLRSTIHNQDRIVSPVILQDPLLLAESALLLDDENMLQETLKLMQHLQATSSENAVLLESSSDTGAPLEEDNESENVSTLRMKIAAAQLQDSKSHVGSSGENNIPMTIWSFSKMPNVDEDSRSFLHDLDRKIHALRNRPQSASAHQHSSNNNSNHNDLDDNSHAEEFPETNSTDLLLSSSLDMAGTDLLSEDTNQGEAYIAKFLAMMEDATYRPEEHLLGEVDHERLQRVQEIMKMHRRQTEDADAAEDVDADDEDEDEVDLDIIIDRVEYKEGESKMEKKERKGYSLDSKVEISRIDYESKAATASWCLDQQQQMMLAELELDREMAALTAALTQSAYELENFDKLSS